MQLYNHRNSPGWTEVHKRLNMRNNGAAIYSENITKWYYPIFQEVFADFSDVALVTVTRESHPVRFKERLIFCFRHECRFRQQNTVENCLNFCRLNKHARVIFIVWDEDCAQELTKHGMNALFLPMAIDVAEVRAHKLATETPLSRTGSETYTNRVIYFGNLRAPKQSAYYYLKLAVQRHGWYLDRISADRLNDGRKLTRAQILETISRYRYGVGVGICAHEMAALGLRTYIYAYTRKGHLPMSQAEGQYLLHRNLCSPELATVPPTKALQNFASSVVITPRDIKDNQQYLTTLLSGVRAQLRS